MIKQFQNKLQNFQCSCSFTTQIFDPIINFNFRMQLREAERFEEEIVEVVAKEAEMAAQHLEEEEDLIEEEQVLWKSA